MRFTYPDWIKKEIERVLRHGLFPVGTPLRPVSLQDDFGGIDVEYVVDQSCPLQLRCRFDRPPGAENGDVTFRDTEPAMMRNGTYAPLAVFFWFTGQRIIAARVVDIERMLAALDRQGKPISDQSRFQSNFDDGPGFYWVGIDELCAAQALLKIFDGDHWATFPLGGQMRVQHILKTTAQRWAKKR